MKKTGAVIFIIACLVVCLIPSVGMFFKPNVEAIGNEESSALPSITNEDGSFNTNILSDLGNYFELGISHSDPRSSRRMRRYRARCSAFRILIQ